MCVYIWEQAVRSYTGAIFVGIGKPAEPWFLLLYRPEISSKVFNSIIQNDMQVKVE